MWLGNSGQGGRRGGGERMEFRGYDSPRQLLELKGVGVYLRPAVEAGGAEGELLEREMGKGEELMMTK